MPLFPHQTLIKENDIQVADLPEELVELIKEFDSKFDDYEIAEEENDDEEVKEIKTELKELSGQITSEIKEYLEDNEVSEQEDKKIPKDKEGILKYLFEEGYKEVSISDLKKFGYPTGPFSKLLNTGEKLQKFELRKVAGDRNYKILKV
ncbi:MAG TPA: hypothetical protein VF691_11130 [Cytophagaceae bacterium]|jgi:hypothetical protein